ncbi:hypothetical protein [Microbacterium sp. KR10-403]|uniref:hypothetical protein n=1 Tax=Microbacterium sp. KR10-403 TaxID=3158581 RepID=UPI0032E4BEC5
MPWRVDSLYDTHPLVTNAGTEALDFVRALVSAGRVRQSHQWGQMLPGETAELCLCAYDLERTAVTLAWFRPGDGGEFAWCFRPCDAPTAATAQE